MTTTHSKSPVQIFRQRVLGPGASDHNGRGAFDMDTERTYDEIMARVQRLQEKTDLIVSVRPGDRGATEIIFRATRDPKTNEKWYYRRFIVSNCGKEHPASVWGVMAL